MDRGIVAGVWRAGGETCTVLFPGFWSSLYKTCVTLCKLLQPLASKHTITLWWFYSSQVKLLYDLLTELFSSRTGKGKTYSFFKYKYLFVVK